MLTKTTIAGLMMGLMVIGAPLVYADQGPGSDWHQDGGGHHEHMEHMLAKVLNLSDDQVKQLKDIWQKQKDTRKASFEQLKSNREAFEAEITKASPDMSKITDLQNQLKTLQGQMTDTHLNNLLDIKKVMSPEQFAGFMALKKAGRMMMHKHKFGPMDGKDGHGSWGNKDHHDGDQDQD